MSFSRAFNCRPVACLVRIAGVLLCPLAAGTALAQDPAPANSSLASLLQGKTAMRQARLAYDGHDLATFLASTAKAAELLPNNPEVLYNLACAHALMGEKTEAVKMLRQVIALGVDFKIDQDPDLASLAKLPEMRELLTQLAGLRQPQGRASLGFSLTEKDFLPEGIVYDARTASFLLGSVRQRTIVRVDALGKPAPWLGQGQQAIDAPLGMAIDPQRRVLWVCTAALPEMSGYRLEDKGRTSLLRVGLDNGSVIQRFEPAADGLNHQLNDVVVAADGGVFVSDSAGGVLYHLKAGGTALDMVVMPGPMTSPQGLALSADEKLLYIADYGLGLFFLEPASKTFSPVGPPPSGTLAGIDGLVRHGASLIAIRNGFRPHAVLRIDLDASGHNALRVRTVLANHPQFDEPTLGVLTGSVFNFVANSQWPRFSARAEGKPAGETKGPVVLKLALGK